MLPRAAEVAPRAFTPADLPSSFAGISRAFGLVGGRTDASPRVDRLASVDAAAGLDGGGGFLRAGAFFFCEADGSRPVVGFARVDFAGALAGLLARGAAGLERALAVPRVFLDLDRPAAERLRERVPAEPFFDRLATGRAGPFFLRVDLLLDERFATVVPVPDEHVTT